MIAVPTSSMVRCAASRGDRPSRMLRSTFSTTRMASSTTIPIASTSPKRVSMFSEKPMPAMIRKVPIRETGIAAMGIRAVRQDCRKISTTSTTRIRASKRVS